MNAQPAIVEPNESRPVDTRLQGRWLWLARVSWLVAALLTVGMFVAGMPLFFAELQQVCTAPANTCISRLTPDVARNLAALGFSLHFHALFTMMLQSLD